MWGNNKCGQIGNKTIEHQFVPIKVMENVVSVESAGLFQAGYTGTITEDGSLYM